MTWPFGVRFTANVAGGSGVVSCVGVAGTLVSGCVAGALIVGGVAEGGLIAGVEGSGRRVDGGPGNAGGGPVCLGPAGDPGAVAGLFVLPTAPLDRSLERSRSAA